MLLEMLNSSRARLNSLVTVGGLIAAVLVLPPSAALAVDASLTDERVTPHDVQLALDQVHEDLVMEPVASVSSNEHLAVVETQLGVTVEVPRNPVEGVTFTNPEGDGLNVSVPNLDQASLGTRLPDGTVAYGGSSSTASAVIPIDGGAQFLTTISNSNGDERFEYSLSLNETQRIELLEDGGAAVLELDGTYSTVFAPAWAKDVRGLDIPTHYEVDGNVLTQVVEHKSFENISYPVTADPVIFVLGAIAVVAAAAVALVGIGVLVWWFNYCRGMGRWPSIDTRGGFTARCVV